MSLHGTADGIAVIEVFPAALPQPGTEDALVIARVWDRHLEGDVKLADLRLTVSQAENLIRGLRYALDRLA